jgi:hypothetical protein
MKKCILIMVCLMVMGASTVMADNTITLQQLEQRTIVPYPTAPNTTTVATSVKLIETMPFYQDEYRQDPRPHFVPYIRLGPNPNGRGLGTEFGLNFGIFRSHGLGFGINLF